MLNVDHGHIAGSLLVDFTEGLAALRQGVADLRNDVLYPRLSPWCLRAAQDALAKTVDDAYVETRKGQAMHGGFITEPAGEKAPVLSADGVDADGIEFAGMEPGTWTVFPDGHDVKFAELRRPIPTRISSAARSPNWPLLRPAPEHIDLDFKNLNDRQYRALMLENERYFGVVQHHMLVPRTLTKITSPTRTAPALAACSTPSTRRWN